MIMSNYNKATIIAYERGYRVINNKVITPKQNIIKNTEFSIRVENKILKVKVHKLTAYQKFGNKMFQKDIVVRHLDGNRNNNNYENIDIGTQSDNMMDIPKKIRMLKSSKASRKFTEKEVDNIKKFHIKYKSYKKTMEKYNIISKGTLHYIINNKYIKLQ